VVMMLHLWVGVVSWEEESKVDHACIWAARVRGLRIIWNEMQSLLLSMCVFKWESYLETVAYVSPFASDDHVLNIPWRHIIEICPNPEPILPSATLRS
jgi:hypothetical protein